MHAHTRAHPHTSIHAHTKEICTYDKGSFIYEARGNQMNIFIWPSRPRAAVIYAVSTDTQDVSTDENSGRSPASFKSSSQDWGQLDVRKAADILCWLWPWRTGGWWNEPISGLREQSGVSQASLREGLLYIKLRWAPLHAPYSKWSYLYLVSLTEEVWTHKRNSSDSGRWEVRVKTQRETEERDLRRNHSCLALGLRK